MKLELSEKQRQDQASFKEFVDREISPCADEFDRVEAIPPELIDKMAREKYLGAVVPASLNGSGFDLITFCVLSEELGRGSSSVLSLLTVHSMLSYAIMRWGSREHKESWLPKLASGETIGAFALTEPRVGSDAKSIETSATKTGDCYILEGQKKWISFGQIANLFLVFAQCNGKATAFLIERDTPGLAIQPIFGMLGLRASMLAELRFEKCKIPCSNRIGGEGFGFMTVALSALEIGRLSVASGSVGIGQACLNASTKYTQERQQYGVFLKDHQLIRQMVTNMVTNVRAARLLCYEAAYLKSGDAQDAATCILVAKYFASTMAMRAAADAVQIQGATGCSAESPVQRYFRDAKVMEIIEGSTQIQQILIADSLYG